MSVQDYRINAEVRRFLVSRWVDVSRLQLGATNGIVYIIGSLDTTMEDRDRRLEQMGKEDRILVLARTVERDIRRIRDVRDVVFKLDTIVKRGGRWRFRIESASPRERRASDRMERRRTERRRTVHRVGGAVQPSGPGLEKGRDK